MKKELITMCFAALSGVSALGAVTPNPLLSRGLPAYTSEGVNSYITDGDLTNWKQCTAKEIAFEVGEGPSRLFLTWESYGDCAWATDFTANCSHSGTPYRNFKVYASANSTDGKDGDWTLSAEVKGNVVMSRGIYVPFEGMSWIRLVSEEEVGQLLEVEIFDASVAANDTWFFMGTSISQMGLKQQDTDSTTADIIHARFPAYTPAMLRGGIGCINSTEVVSHLQDYLQYAGNVKYWAIEMGTNDAWGGGDWNVEIFRKNMQTIIDAAKEHGIEPILARIIATNEQVAGWQVNPKFLDVIDELTEQNHLHPGPDFYTYFLNHPEQLASDGVHPNGQTLGGQAMHHLWAEALAPIYAESIAQESGWVGSEEMRPVSPILSVEGSEIKLSQLPADVKVELFDPSGVVVERFFVSNVDHVVLPSRLPAGLYVILAKWEEGVISRQVVIR